MKTCTRCNTEKPLDDFHRNQRGRHGRAADCKPCARRRYRTWYKANYDPEHNRANRLRQNYGVTVEWYEARKADGCGICGTHEPGGTGDFHVDHDHDTGEARGVLCSACNLGIGKLGDNVEGLRRALAYLEAA